MPQDSRSSTCAGPAFSADVSGDRHTGHTRPGDRPRGRHLLRPSGWIVLLIVAAAAGNGQAESAFVQFELAMETGFPTSETRRWLELFQTFEHTRARVRAARRNERAVVDDRGSEAQPHYHVVGLLTRRNKLVLPGAQPISPNDRAGIAKWIEQLRESGIQPAGEVRVAFDLTSQELVALHTRMAEPVTFETANVRAGDVTRKIVNGLSLGFQVTDTARRAFAKNGVFPDEMRSLSQGTVLASVLRSQGLAFAPRKKRGAIELMIADAGELDEWWPVGWPPVEADFKTAPALFKYLPVAINSVPLPDAMSAIQGRVDVPFVYDRRAIADKQIDLSQEVSFPNRKALYKKILDHLLFQVQLKSEIRTDDGGRPFLWIKTIH